MSHTFATTTRGLRRDSLPMRLFEKAKQLGVWNPTDIDMEQDKRDWAAMSDQEQDLILRLTAMFQAGEEAVTLDLLPLIMAVAKGGHIEEEMFLTTFLWEEAKHTDFFSCFLTEIGQVGDLTHYHSPQYRAVFYEALPTHLHALTTDQSPAAMVRASATYNMIVEGMLAETGYHAFFSMLEENDVMPGLRHGIYLLKQDESRHIAYGVHLISRLIAESPATREVFEQTMNTLMPQAMGVVHEIFAAYEEVPFSLKLEDFTAYAMMQYQMRYNRITQSVGA